MSKPVKAVANFFSTNVPLVTTAETLLLSLEDAPLPFDTSRVIIICFVQLTTSADTTTVTLRCRRGATVTGDLVGEANAITIPSAAGGTDQYLLVVSEVGVSGGRVQYSLTAQQAGASANGSALQGAMLALFF